jgi:hypothetical protein
MTNDRESAATPPDAEKPGKSPGAGNGQSDASVVADVEQPDAEDINPLAPPINTEAGA